MLTKTGYIVVTIAFLAAALASVVDPQDVRWPFFITALAAGGAGVALIHVGQKKHHHAEHKLSADMENVETSLTAIVKNISALDGEKASLSPEQIAGRIDRLFKQDLSTFVDSRRVLARMYGLQTYADVMSCFASAERYLNRTWSACVDGYTQEARNCIQKSREQFTLALEKINEMTPDP